MRKLYVGLLTVMVAFSFGSCSTFENEVDAPQEKLLKTYKLSRTADGAYSMDYDVADNTSSRSFKNIDSNKDEIYLSKGGNNVKSSYSKDFTLEDNQIKVGFIDEVSGKTPSIMVEDEDGYMAKGDNGEFLQEYSVTSNGDGTYQLDFSVRNGVKTEFLYNKDLDIYEVHLSNGTSETLSFSRTIDMPDTNVLKIDFVNHKYAGRTEETTAERKPRVIIIEE